MTETMTEQMRWASALSTRPSLEAAVKEAVEHLQPLIEASPDLGLIFISAAFASEYSRLMPLLQEYLSIPVLIGCSGGGVVGVDLSGQIQEIEDKAALSLCLAKLPRVKVQAFHISGSDLPDLDAPPHRWVDLTGVSPQDNPHFILLSDPFSSGINDLLQGLDFAYPGSIKVGGLASVGSMGSRSTLFSNYETYSEGTVGVALSGEIVIESIVAQGCRPIGQPYRVAEGDRNILIQLEQQISPDAGVFGAIQTPLEALQEIFQTLSEADRQLAQQSLFVGLAQSEFKQNLKPGDFLIRNLIGVDPRNGAIAIGDRVRPGQRIQFHLRDAQASEQDLRSLLEHYQLQNRPGSTSVAGALMFSCMGRGEGLYGQPNFDSRLFHQYLKDIPLSGFFCGGEIGPVGTATFLHGYTSVFGICRQP